MVRSKRMKVFLMIQLLLWLTMMIPSVHSFAPNEQLRSMRYGSLSTTTATTVPIRQPQQKQPQQSALYAHNNNNNKNNRRSDQDDAADIEQARLNILTARRNQIRSTLKSAEALRHFRWKNGFIPDIDPDTGRPISDGKVAVTLTAFMVAAGAIALRIGGRAALVSAVGLDFLTTSPELKDNLEWILTTADSMDPVQKVVIFTACWTAVKVFCVDAGGVVLALSSGILFGGVIQGALLSAAAATVGSLTAFSLAKADSPVREKALELLEEYPSLRGIEKVVARDGLKAVLTLRLAPVLPIPIGMYNYIYGVTNVPVTAFCGGIFLGSLKPYLLDSYLGYFGKEVIQGTTDSSGMQDVFLLGALGISVLIGVFASQLAGETWDSVLEEVELEKKAKKGTDDQEEEDDGITRELFGIELPEWMVGFQLSLKAADHRINGFIAEEQEAMVWNYTDVESIPAHLDPARRPDSPERTEAHKGLDLAASTCDGLVLSPLLFGAFVNFADPFYDKTAATAEEDVSFGTNNKAITVAASIDVRSSATNDDETVLLALQDARPQMKERLAALKSTAQARIDTLNEQIRRQDRMDQSD